MKHQKFGTVNTYSLLLFTILVCSLQSCRTNSAGDVSKVKYESDQYSASTYFATSVLKDETERFNTLINDGIQTQLVKWRQGYNPLALSYEISAFFSRRQLEIWVIDNPSVSSFLPATKKSVYKKTDYPTGRTGRFLSRLPIGIRSPLIRAGHEASSLVIQKKGLAANISLAGVEIGADKLTHFFGLGAVYLGVYQKYVNDQLALGSTSFIKDLPKSDQEKIRKQGEKKAIAYGVVSENGRWGKTATGVFSNADLVANYQGFRWLRDIAEDRSEYVGWTIDGKPFLKIPFDLRTFVNPYWNEAINPNEYSAALKPTVEASLFTYCGAFKKFPERFVASNTKELEKKFKKAGIKKYSSRKKLRLDQVCKRFNSMTSREKKKYKQVKAKPVTESRIQKHAGVSRGLRFKNEQGETITDQAGIEKYLLKQSKSVGTCHKAVKFAIREHELVRSTHLAQQAEMVNILNGQLVETKPEHTIGAPSPSACRSVPVLSPDIRSSIRLSIDYCKDSKNQVSYQYQVKYRNKIVQSLEDIDALISTVFDGEYRYVSLPGFFEFNDTAGYVYRAIPVLCRWY